ncbi:YeeE/YedE family protein [Roseospira marina]|uniref:YeeE/YedE family protein n=1 Tax=Roseospira marina TaxID=140057 RepID=A0A5M6IEM4_9PROT|nr:YeeE/YedE family protein [Roseospira marina]KAA5606714.1 YeeE/YedE family protein [Roseospira marina]MBB4313871.1 putative membrane protein YedE/YeeE [Roseospira marina]MBB5087033.1 putative membrane protein YedE/YeeE [Roseospira marina]
MDLTGVLEAFGDSSTIVVGGLLIGLLFGGFAQRSRFCLRAAVIEFARGSVGPKMALWLVAFATAVLSTQALIQAGLLDVGAARQLGAAGSLSGAIIGGLMFGVGMILTRGCSSRLLVLSATGNLRALLSGLIFAVTAQASLRGVLAPVRETLAGLWVVDAPSVLNGLTLLGLDAQAGVVIGIVLFGLALYFAARNRLSAWAWVGGLGVGATIAVGWLFTYSLSYQAWDPVAVKSLSFTGPSADALMLVLSPLSGVLDFDNGLVPGVFLGAFLAAWVSGDLRLQGFTGGYGMRRYIVGAAFMGFGGMLAGGCAVGAGLTGGSVFALTAWTALFCMWVGAALADWIVDRAGLLLQDDAAAGENAQANAIARGGWVFLPEWRRRRTVDTAAEPIPVSASVDAVDATETGRKVLVS